MPELPEVETVARSIAPLVGRRILSAEFRSVRVLRGGDPEAMAACLQGRRIQEIRRYGKFIVIRMEGGYLTIHLGMTGRLLLGGPAGKHTHAILMLDQGVLLYDDSRQFGRLQWSGEFPARVAQLGPEPLEIGFPEFARMLKSRKARIKALLLNQDFLRGIGNIYADEALFRAGIHPMAQACRLRGGRPRKLYDAIQTVLQEAIAAGGSSIADYVDAQGRKGFFQIQHRVYQREGEPCVRCGRRIRRVLVAQRSSHYCPGCQKR
jgi:formamidopyrimidine-DNA glycosylase